MNKQHEPEIGWTILIIVVVIGYIILKIVGKVP